MEAILVSVSCFSLPLSIYPFHVLSFLSVSIYPFHVCLSISVYPFHVCLSVSIYPFHVYLSISCLSLVRLIHMCGLTAQRARIKGLHVSLLCADPIPPRRPEDWGPCLAQHRRRLQALRMLR